MSATGDLDEVLAGQSGKYHWVLRAGPVSDVFVTHLDIYAGERHVDGGGMGGRAVPSPSKPVQYSYGRRDDLPVTVAARCMVHVDRMVAVADDGSETEMTLSEPVEKFGMKFAACLLPASSELAGLRAESHGKVIFEGAAHHLHQ
ncbi:hypothetical protein AB0J38_24885 [Streptomyces sp. NPDC050095]|uniref:hypothetical protein n=1 Tax=unclassified Streptomyces TaxID=2593676 RepID=UPI003422EE55